MISFGLSLIRNEPGSFNELLQVTEQSALAVLYFCFMEISLLGTGVVPEMAIKVCSDLFKNFVVLGPYFAARGPYFTELSPHILVPNFKD